MINFCRYGHHIDEHSANDCIHQVADDLFCGCREYEEEDPGDRIVQGHVPDWIGRYGDGIGEAYRRAGR